ncbi:MAG: hypothetical protein PHR35_09560 [Kiritimatiellae bacterium]|nr:hypothetical protein [Kiritimatiellia bacterium]
MFYRFDFTYRQYRRRRMTKCGAWGLGLLAVAAFCLFSYRLHLMTQEPTLDQRLYAFNPVAQRLLQSLRDWNQSRDCFREIEPFWLLDTAAETPAALLAVTLTNQPSWSLRLAPRRLSMRANGQAELEFGLWFQPAENKAEALAETRAALQQGLASWQPHVSFEEESKLADRESIGVKVACTPPPHHWPDGMAPPPKRMAELAAAISNQHAAIWSSAPLKGYDKATTLRAALEQALVQAMQCLDMERGRAAMVRWKACLESTLAPDEVFGLVRRDLSTNGAAASLPELDKCEAAWTRLACRWWCRARRLDTPALRELSAACDALYALPHPPPPHETFAGFALWLDQYRQTFTNAVSLTDIRMNGADKTILKNICARALPNVEPPRIETAERAVTREGALVGFCDWTVRTGGGDAGKAGAGLKELHLLAATLDRAPPGVRLESVEIVFGDKLRPPEAWSKPPESGTLRGTLPWRAAAAAGHKGGQP